MNKPKDAKEKIEPSFGSYKREWEVKEKAVEIQSFIDFLNELRNKLKYVSDIKFMKKLITYLNTTHDCEEKIKKLLQIANNRTIEITNFKVEVLKLQKENIELKNKIQELNDVTEDYENIYLQDDDELAQSNKELQKENTELKEKIERLQKDNVYFRNQGYLYQQENVKLNDKIKRQK